MRHKNKPDGLQRNAPSLDGIVPRGHNLGVPVHRSYQLKKLDETPTLGQMGARMDGFHPARQSSGGLGGTAAEAAERNAVLDEPIVLDELDYDKRKDKVKGKIRRAKWRKVVKRSALVLLILIIA